MILDDAISITLPVLNKASRVSLRGLMVLAEIDIFREEFSLS
jgi:hypothetical protein